MPSTPTLAAPSNDKRWKLVEAVMRRHGYKSHALIETLHVVQDAFGYVDESALRFVAKNLRTPLSRAYGVVTFYHHFLLKPQGKHTCVVCLGTACYIRGAHTISEFIHKRFGIKPGETTRDGRLSYLSARCLGSCGIAPAVVFDGQVVGKMTPQAALEQLEKVIHHDH